MILSRRDHRRSFFTFVFAVFLLFIVIAYKKSNVEPSSTIPQSVNDIGTGKSSWEEEIDDMGGYSPSKQPTSGSVAYQSSDPSFGVSSATSTRESGIAKTDLETIIPSASLPSDPSIQVEAHAHGFTVFDRLYLRNGTFYVVTTNDKFPPRRNLIAKPFDIGTGVDLEPTDEDMQFLHPSKVKEVLGEFAIVIPGVTVFLHDPAQFMLHFYHWWGEIILGMWRVYSVLSLGQPDYVPGKPLPVPFPSRFIMPVINNQEWRDPAGVNGPLMRAAFPNTPIERKDYWRDLQVLETTVVFERSMIVNRETAHRHPFGTRWFKMIAGTMNVTVPDRFWEPVRHSILENLLGYVPEVDSHGKFIPSSLSVFGSNSRPAPPAPAAAPPANADTQLNKPHVTYISRQGAGRRLTAQDHEQLVKALKGLEEEGLCTVEVAMMERLTLKQQLSLDARTTIMVGIHGNGLTHQLFMPPSKRSTVFEIFSPPAYVFDYEMLARNMGHKHYAVHNDTLITYRKGEYNEGVHYTSEFHGNSIPVYGPVIADMIRKRLTDAEKDLED